MIMPILTITNIDTSIAFYKDKLGFNIGTIMNGADGKPNFAIATWGQQISIGLSLATAASNVGQGVDFMVYPPEATDIDSYYETVQRNGASIAQPIKTEYWGDRLFGLKDPDGYNLMFCQTVEQKTDEEIAVEHGQQ